MFRFRLLAMTLLLVCSSRAALAQPGFLITAPAQGSVFTTGQTVTVEWTGGDPAWTVDLQLIDDDIYTVVRGVGGLANTGSYEWTFDANLTCGHLYQFYVQDRPLGYWTYGPQFTIVCEIPVAIDIKPGGGENSINPHSKGTTPVAILSTATFDAPAAVDPSTLTFGRTGDEHSLAFCNGAGEDVNGDGILDLVCHFTTANAGFLQGDTAGLLKGKTVDGRSIVGTDAVRIVRNP